MATLERIISVIAPHYCLVCGSEGALVCMNCRPDFALPVPSRCALCQRYTPESQVCAACRRKSPLRHIWVQTEYDGLPKQLVRGFKYDHQQAAAPLIAGFMARALPFIRPDTIIVHVPTATSRVRQRGYDHAALLAKELARLLKTKHYVALARIGQVRQVGSKREQRLRQLESAFEVLEPELIQNRPVLLVDDVMTTGGTLNAVAKKLRQTGVKSVDAVVFAQKQ